MAKARTVMDREQWIAILDEAATRRGNELNDEWRWLLDELGMTANEYPALVEALRQRRWRDSKNPRAYLKTVARREAFQEKLTAEREDMLAVLPAPAGNAAFSVEGALNALSYSYETVEAVQSPDGVWRPGGGGERGYAEYYDEDDDGRPVSLRGRLRSRLPETLLKAGSTPKNEDEQEEIDWRHVPIRVDLNEWARLANMDAWEMQVVQCHRDGISRDKALAQQPNENSRKAMQAAWRKFDRTGKQRLKEVAEKMLAKNVPEPPGGHTR